MAKRAILEEAVMNLLWDADGPMTPGDVRELLIPDHQLAYTTVMTVMSRLWKKGLLQRDVSGRAYSYTPVQTREAHGAERMEEILEAAGNRAVALTRFVDELSNSDRKRLRSLLGD